MKFEARREWCWTTVFTRGLAVAFLLLAVYAARRVFESGAEGIFPQLMSIVPCIIFLWMGIQEGLKFTRIDYEISDAELRIRCGFHKFCIPLECIRKVVRSRCALPCAFSNQALEVHYLKGRLCGHRIVVAPIDQQRFLQLLRAGSPACEIVGAELKELSLVVNPARIEEENVVPISVTAAPGMPDAS
ncbi:MAG: PH domain-containing protein [Planctomycetes bacterium]|nr:PH domain-containing protein [Planctomycetota bacterium]